MTRPGSRYRVHMWGQSKLRGIESPGPYIKLMRRNTVHTGTLNGVPDTGSIGIPSRLNQTVDDSFMEFP